MTQITFQDGKVVVRDGKVGTEQECCCKEGSECECLDLCENADIRATYQGQTLAIGDEIQIGGNLITEGREDWSFRCGSFETIDENGNPYTFDGLLFSYTKILANCEEDWTEDFFLSCSGGQWSADIVRGYRDPESIGGQSPCFDDFAPPCTEYWFDVPVSVDEDCLPTGDIEASGEPDLVNDSSGEAPCGLGTYGTLTLGRA